MVTQQGTQAWEKKDLQLQKTSYDARIEEYAQKGAGYKAANLLDLQQALEEFNNSEEGKKECLLFEQKYGIKIKAAVPSFKVVQEHELVAHLDKYAASWRDDWQDFVTNYNNQLKKDCLSSENEKKLKKLEQRIRETFKKYIFHTELLKDVDTYMIRSSGKHEDKVNMASPGSNVSETSNNDPINLSTRIGESFASYFAPKSIDARLTYGDPDITDLPSSGVIIHGLAGEEVNGHGQVVSGVIYTHNNYTVDIQAAPGHGKKIVESKGMVDTYHVNEDEVITERTEPKETRYKIEIKNIDGRQQSILAEVKNNLELKYSSSLNKDVLRFYKKLSIFLEKKNAMPLDIEFVYSEGDLAQNKDSRAYIVQKRAKPQNNNKAFQPSSISPQFLSTNKDNPSFHIVNGLQVITPTINRAVVVAELKQAVFADNCDQAVSKYNKAEDKSAVKAVIVQTQEAELSHASGFLLGKGLVVMQVANTKEVNNLLQQNPKQPLIIDPQRSKIYQLPDEYQTTTEEAFYTKNQEGESILVPGIHSSSLPSKINASKYEFSGLDVESAGNEPLPLASVLQALNTKKLGDFIAEAEIKNSESAHLLFSLMHHASFGQKTSESQTIPETAQARKDKAKTLRDNIEKLVDISIGQSTKEHKEALGYILRANIDSKKKGIITKDLFNTNMVLGANLFLLLNRIEKLDNSKLSQTEKNQAYLEYFDLCQQFKATVTGYGDSLASSLKHHKYIDLAKELAPGIKEETQGILIDSLKLGEYLLNKDIEDKKTTASWYKFCTSICTSTAHAKKLATMLQILKGYNADDQWLNYIFTQVNDPEDPKKTLANLLKDFKKLEPVLPKIQQAAGLIDNMESQISAWAEPNKFEDLYNHLQENLKTINENLKWNPHSTNLEKILVIEQIHRLADTILDKSIKNLTRSSQYTDDMLDKKGNNLQAARFLEMLYPFYDLMDRCVSNTKINTSLSLYQDTVANRLLQLKQFLDSKGGKALSKAEMELSANFSVNRAVIDNPGRIIQPSTLEDCFTQIHQNILISLGYATQDLNKIIERQFPPLLENLNDTLNKKLLKVQYNKKSISANKIRVAKGKVIVNKNLPLRNHAATVKFEYVTNTKSLEIKFNIFGGGDERWQHMLLDSKIDLMVSDCNATMLSDKQNIGFLVKNITNTEQIKAITKAINKSIGMSFNLHTNKLITARIKNLDILQMRKAEQISNMYFLPQIPITWSTFKEMQQNRPGKASFIINNYDDLRILLKIGLTFQQLLEMYDNAPAAAQFFITNSYKIKALSKAGFIPQEILKIYHTNAEVTEFILSNYKGVKSLLEQNRLLMDDILKGDFQQLKQLIDKKTVPEQLKETASQGNTQIKQANKLLERTVEIDDNSPSKTILSSQVQDLLQKLSNLQNNKDSELPSISVHILKYVQESLINPSIEAQKLAMRELLSLKNSKDPALKSIFMSILEHSQELLKILPRNIHPMFIRALFDSQNTQDPKLKSISTHVLKDFTGLMKVIKSQEARYLFMQKFFDLRHSENSVLRTITLDMLKNLPQLLPSLDPKLHSLALSELFNLRKSKNSELQQIALEVLKKPLELFKVLGIPGKKQLQKMYSSCEDLPQNQTQLQILVSNEALKIMHFGYSSLDDLKNLDDQEIVRLTSKEAYDAYKLGITLTFMRNYSLDSQEGQKLLTLYHKNKLEEATNYQILQCVKKLQENEKDLSLLHDKMNILVEQLSIPLLQDGGKIVGNNKQQIQKKVTMIAEAILKSKVGMDIQQSHKRSYSETSQKGDTNNLLPKLKKQAYEILATLIPKVIATTSEHRPPNPIPLKIKRNTNFKSKS